MNNEAAIQGLGKIGWTVSPKIVHGFKLPARIARRYPRLPEELTDFISRMSVCTNQAQTTWFLCEADYAGTSDSAFTWDEWERLSLGSAKDDKKACAEISGFWDSHFPFMFSVHSGYSFHAVCLDPSRYGTIVEGYEPAFEETTQVAESFGAFLALLLRPKK